MKIQEIKCSNCNAPIPLSEDRPIHFCPFCGAAVKIDYDKYDFERFKLKHEEEVRQKKAQEKKEEDIRNTKIMFALLATMLGIALFVTFLSYMH